MFGKDLSLPVISRLRWKPPFLVALSAGFSFQEQGLSDELMKEERESTLRNHRVNEGWEILVKQKDLLVVKREREDTGLNEYCCSGSYSDISAQDFIDAQMDLEYRQKWDAHVITLEVLEEDKGSDAQVIRWVAKYPYPLYPREYIYVRRRHIDEENHCVTIVSSSLEGDVYPSCSDYVRVSNYRSVMVVKSHRSFSEKGFDYVLSYHDNPEGNIPRYAYNWIVNSGGPNFLTKVHAAAKELENARASGTNVLGSSEEVSAAEKIIERPINISSYDQADDVILPENLLEETRRKHDFTRNSQRSGDSLEKELEVSVGNTDRKILSSTEGSDDNGIDDGRVSMDTANQGLNALTTAELSSSVIETPVPSKPQQEVVDADVNSNLTASRFLFCRKTWSSVSDLLKLVE